MKDHTRPPDRAEQTDAAQRSYRLRGIALMCFAGFCFSTIDTAGKFLNHSMTTTQVAWARFFGSLIFAIFLSKAFTQPHVMRSNHPWLQLVRALLLLLSNVLNLYALRFLQLDQTLSIMFAVPFIVAVFAVPILGERIGPRRWAAICVGFVGVLVVTQPGSRGIHPAAALTLGAAMTYSLYAITTRVLAPKDSSNTTLFHTNLIGAVILSLAVPFVWVTPTWGQFAVMGIMAGMASLGHYLLILAHRLAPASILAPFMYLQLVWMTFYGYTVFGDLPNHWTLTGAAIVIASGLYLLSRERKVKGTAAPMSGDTTV